MGRHLLSFLEQKALADYNVRNLVVGWVNKNALHVADMVSILSEDAGTFR